MCFLHFQNFLLLTVYLTLMHSERPKLYIIFGLNEYKRVKTCVRLVLQRTEKLEIQAERVKTCVRLVLHKTEKLEFQAVLCLKRLLTMQVLFEHVYQAPSENA